MKTWVIVRELANGKLIAEGPDGRVWGSYDRTIPADGSKDENWTHELVTDISGLVRASVVRMTKDGGHAESRFERKI
jgi:hypothetical protein